MKLRSLLFAPGDSPRKADKALASAADGVILDLEDSVAPDGKADAREAIAILLGQVSHPNVVVRVNPPSTPWYLDDLAAVVPGKPGAVMLPKCSGPGDLAALDHQELEQRLVDLELQSPQRRTLRLPAAGRVQQVL